MSGGFFRGTTADQDTRFSNKTRKLLKAQKFPAELDEPVDVSKVNMDVIKPWIAKRVKDFLGFEDDVLINFIYTLLELKQGVDGKILQIDGKMIQIQLTGFLEKNTGKFMKELWSLLISAQKNVSGIPQQFLDEKAEETRQKKAEEERIRAEIMRKREEADKEAEAEHQRKISAAVESAKLVAAAAALKAGLAKTGPLHVDQVLTNVEEPTSAKDEPAAGEESEKSGRTSSSGETSDEKKGGQNGGKRSGTTRKSESKSSEQRSRSSSPESDDRSSRSVSRSQSPSSSPRKYMSPPRRRRARSPPRRRRSPYFSRSSPRRRRYEDVDRSPPRRRRSPYRSPPRWRRYPPRSPPRRYRSPAFSDSPPRRSRPPRSPPRMRYSPARRPRSPYRSPYCSPYRSPYRSPYHSPPSPSVSLSPLPRRQPVYLSPEPSLSPRHTSSSALSQSPVRRKGLSPSLSPSPAPVRRTRANPLLRSPPVQRRLRRSPVRSCSPSYQSEEESGSPLPLRQQRSLSPSLSPSPMRSTSRSPSWNRGQGAARNGSGPNNGPDSRRERPWAGRERNRFQSSWDERNDGAEWNEWVDRGDRGERAGRSGRGSRLERTERSGRGPRAFQREVLKPQRAVGEKRSFGDMEGSTERRTEGYDDRESPIQTRPVRYERESSVHNKQERERAPSPWYDEQESSPVGKYRKSGKSVHERLPRARIDMGKSRTGRHERSAGIRGVDKGEGEDRNERSHKREKVRRIEPAVVDSKRAGEIESEPEYEDDGYDDRGHHFDYVETPPLEECGPQPEESDAEMEEERVKRIEKWRGIKQAKDAQEDQERYSSPLASEERRAAKQRKKEEKRARKAARRARREERRKRKALASVAAAAMARDMKKESETVSLERTHGSDQDGDDGYVSSEAEKETEERRKWYEEMLRSKALESLRAAKAGR